MSYELTAKNENVATVTINQSAWPAIWHWLCDNAGAELPVHYRQAGLYNGSLRHCTAIEAHVLANILADKGHNGPSELHVYGRALQDGTRAERLIRFFRACDGFAIY